MEGGSQLSTGPPRPAELLAAGRVILRRHRPSDRAALVAAVNESLAHLAPWMPWARRPAPDASIGVFLAEVIRDFGVGANFGYAIVEPGETDGTGSLLGGCGLHQRIGPGGIEIGYWVHVAHLRRGIARAAAVALRNEAFSMGIARVEIRCDQRNTASAAVARGAGFELVGTALRPAQTPSESDREMIWRAEPPVG